MTLIRIRRHTSGASGLDARVEASAYPDLIRSLLNHRGVTVIRRGGFVHDPFLNHLVYRLGQLQFLLWCGVS